MTMDIFLVVFVFFFIVFGGFAISHIFSFQNRRKEVKQFLEKFGFTPIEPSENLTEFVSRLYRIPNVKETFELQHVYQKDSSEYCLFIFDLLETSGGEYVVKERQGVAIISNNLHLPQFMIIPKVNKVLTGFLERSLRSWGNQLIFPHHQTINHRYLVISREPTSALAFIESRLASTLVHTHGLTLCAGSNIFTLSEFHESNTLVSPETLQYHIQSAVDLYQKFHD